MMMAVGEGKAGSIEDDAAPGASRALVIPLVKTDDRRRNLGGDPLQLLLQRG